MCCSVHLYPQDERGRDGQTLTLMGIRLAQTVKRIPRERPFLKPKMRQHAVTIGCDHSPDEGEHRCYAGCAHSYTPNTSGQGGLGGRHTTLPARKKLT